MQRLPILCILPLLTGMLHLVIAVAPTDTDLETLSLPELKQQLESIGTELEQLASYSPRSGSGTLGYTSNAHPQPENKEWVRIELGAELLIDQIILVPSLKRNPGVGLEAEGFPRCFRILAGTEHSSQVIAMYTDEDHLLPRIAPLAISCRPLKASWVTVEATSLTQRDWDDRYALYLSEIFVFSGQENVALHQPVKTLSSTRAAGRHETFVVDGFVPYLMDSSLEGKSQAITFRTSTPTPSIHLTIDLKAPTPINQINLHTADLSRTIPQTAPSDYAVPRHLRVSGANKKDFSDQRPLFEYRHDSVYDTGPIIALDFPETVCRYVRFELIELQSNNTSGKNSFVATFAEIEILSKGQNIAFGKPVTKSDLPRSPRNLQRLTDGKNFFGKILPVRNWMNQLARRHDLETLRPLIEAELARRYERQKNNLTRMAWLATLIAVVIGFSILIERLIHRNQLENMRNRFAADLHDELGANLHAIGLLGDLAKESVHTPDELVDTLDEIRALTERSGQAARHCADIYDAHLCGNLKADMERTARRILADIEYQLSIEDEKQLQTLKPRRQADLYLFFKESLVNISRHSGASQCHILLTAEQRKITLVISDNGRGISGKAPPSLKRRARLLKGKLTLGKAASGGTTITLQLQRQRGLLRLFSHIGKQTDESNHQPVKK